MCIKPKKIISKFLVLADVVKTGLLLVNLGTPEATDYLSMRCYLKEFLSDKRVIEARGPVWWLVLNGIILSKRPQKSGRAYDLIWNKARNESPLKTITRAQADKLSEAFSTAPKIVVEWGMRYGKPSIADAIARLVGQGCERLVIFPLYPQYSGATTGTAMDSVFNTLKTLRYQPSIRSVPPYFAHQSYIDALAQSIRQHHATLDWKPEVTIASLHGLPIDFIAKGDPYREHCKATVAHLREALDLDKNQLLLSYQSRSGRTEWMTPDTEDTMVALAENGVRNLTVVAPGFAADCIETLEELHLRATKKFLAAGGENCSVIPCLNDSDISIEMLHAIAKENLLGWGFE